MTSKFATMKREMKLLLLATALLAGVPIRGAAQLPGMRPAPSDSARRDSLAADSAARANENVSPQSPRVSLQHYLELTRAGEYATAAAYLDVPDSLRGQAPTLARQLKAVLDRHVWFDLTTISPLATGDTSDDLPRGVDQVATIPSGGVNQPVRLARTQTDTGAVWRFTRATVMRVPAWYGDLSGRWAMEHLPDALLRPGPYELLWWQWLALPLLFAAAVMVGLLVSVIARALLGRVVARTRSDWDDALLERLATPFTVFFTLTAATMLLPTLALYAPASAAVMRIIRAVLLADFFWGLWRLVDVIAQMVRRSHWGLTASSAKSLVPLGSRVTKVIVLAMGAVALLSLLGYPVASLVAGLGLGGLAFALAAQKTVENLFGAFSIGVDQPFREGDFVKVEDFVGTVEAIGLRSTRFRTLDRTIVSLPNGKLADMRLESFAVRDRMRLATVIGLVYETTAAQMKEVLEGFERVLRSHPKIWPDAMVVRFANFGASSLDIEIMAWFQVPEWSDFQLARQEVLLQFMEVVEKAGSSFAFPTRTVHLVTQGNGDGASRAIGGGV
jgi:MscS family membrane protein